MGAHVTFRTLVGACLLGALAAASPGVATAASPAAATVLVDGTPRAALAGAATEGADLVVAWREPVDGFLVPVATVSDDGGTTWRTARPVTGGADAGSVGVVVCDGVAAVTFTADAGTPQQPRRMAAILGAHVTDVDAGWNDFGIATGRVRDPRVACRGRQLMVAWSALTDGTWRLRAALWGDARGYLPDAITPLVRQTFALGRVTGPGRHRPSIAATADRAFVAWVSGGRLRLARWKTAGEAPHDLSRMDDLVLARGSDRKPLGDPLVATDGDQVVVAWTRCGDLLARASVDAGATFGPAVTLFDGRCGSRPSARLDGLDIADGQIAITTRIRRATGDQARILTSDDGLASRSWLTLDQAGDRWIGGWVGTIVPELGAAGDLGDAIAWNPPGSLEP